MRERRQGGAGALPREVRPRLPAWRFSGSRALRDGAGLRCLHAAPVLALWGLPRPRVRCARRQKARQVAVSDELESLRDHIDALEATKARQEVRVHHWRGVLAPRRPRSLGSGAACEACQAVCSNEMLCCACAAPPSLYPAR